MFCALSGEVPEHPVVSRKSGHVFEKRLIEKYIADHGKNPVTGDALSLEDLVEVQGNKSVKPRPPTATSIPSMLGLFQNEWDAVVLETYSLKQQLEQTRQELSHSLYQYEAACRVIARLVKERDALKEEVTALHSNVSTNAPRAQPQNGGSSEMEVDQHQGGEESPDSITSAVLDKITNLSQKLAKDRKKRPAPEGLATAEQVQQFQQKSSNTALHATSPPGILTLDIHSDQRRIVTGGNDKNVVISDRESETILQTLKGHTKKVTSVLFHPTEEMVFSTSADKTLRIWTQEKNGFKANHTLKHHKDEVSAVTLHATGDYVVSASHDSTWAFVDIRSGKVLSQVSNDAVKQGYTTARFHPDGLILGTGTADSVVRVWDLKSQENVATFEGHQGKITSLAFSENGFHLATAGQDNTVRLWDLRKLANFKTISLEGETTSVSFDYSGNYLGVGGADIRIFAAKQAGEIKQWDEIFQLKGHTSTVTDFKFSHDAHFIASASLDRSVRVFGA